MKRNIKITIGIVSAVYGLLALMCLLKMPEEYSHAERRKLAQKPVFTLDTFASGEYAKKTEEYVTDQFPFRDRFRMLKSYFLLAVMQKSDVNGIYEKDGYLCAMEYPMNEESVIRAAELFETIYNKHLKDSEVSAYISVIPDKSYFLAEDGYLSMNYGEFFESMYGETDFLKAIPIDGMLQLSDYYRTDTHWKQEEIGEVAMYLAQQMGAELTGEYKQVTLETPFYGVYTGQAATNPKPDKISYCTNSVLEECKVYDYENNQEIVLYDESMAGGRDAYEMFLGGNISLAVIENPAAISGKELVVFGDSFSRSMVPLLAEGYSKTTLIDIRYLPSAYIGNYVTFTNQDVLFLYSTSVLNNSITLK